MGVGETERFLEWWQLDVDDVLRRMYLAPTPRVFDVNYFCRNSVDPIASPKSLLYESGCLN